MPSVARIVQATGECDPLWWRFFLGLMRAATPPQWFVPIRADNPPSDGWQIYVDADNGDRVTLEAANGTKVVLTP